MLARLGWSHNLLVTIVLTTLNVAAYLTEALDSCLAQTQADWELIIVDGGSTDGTLDIIGRYADPRIRLIHQTDNIGKLPGALNLGLDAARGEYLTWLQGDSRYHPQALAKMTVCLDQHPDVGHVYTDYWVTDAAGAPQSVVSTCVPEAILLAKSDPCGVCFMIRRAVRQAVGPHDVAAYPTQDYDYRLRIAMQFRSYHLAEPLYYWRLHPASLTGSRSWTIDAHNDVFIRLRLGLSTPRQARLDRAEIDMAYAFEHFYRADFRPVPALVWSGLRGDPRFWRNRGVWAILARSVRHILWGDAPDKNLT